MLYLPDVRVVTIEHPPARWLLPAATQLMLRWFGNMLRTSSRTIALGPRRLGAFTWWCLIDQRISMWTPLIGPIVALIFALGKSAIFLYTYLLWVGVTRLIQALAAADRAAAHQRSLPAADLLRAGLWGVGQDLHHVPPRSAALDPAEHRARAAARAVAGAPARPRLDLSPRAGARAPWSRRWRSRPIS